MLSRRPAINILSISPFETDRQLLQSVVGRSNWRLLCAADCLEAWTLMHRYPVSVVITERSFPDGLCWRDLLEETASMQEAPSVIVAARKPNEAFWDEVIRAGAFDLLVKPFNPDEVRSAIGLAWQQSRDAQVLKTGMRLHSTAPLFAGA